MTNKEKMILDNFRELERMKREIFKATMQVIICNGNPTQSAYNLRSMNVIMVNARE